MQSHRCKCFFRALFIFRHAVRIGRRMGPRRKDMSERTLQGCLIVRPPVPSRLPGGPSSPESHLPDVVGQRAIRIDGRVGRGRSASTTATSSRYSSGSHCQPLTSIIRCTAPSVIAM